MKTKYIKYILTGLCFVIIFSCLYAYTAQKDAQFIVQGEIDTKDVDLASKITGRVKHIAVKEGDIVKAGTVLLTLDIPDIAAQKQQAKAAYTLALQTYNRVKPLKEKGFASVQAYDDAYAELKSAENKLKEAQSYEDENSITAPVTGQVKDVDVEEGELVSAGYTIITMIDTTDVWAVFNLREDLLSKIRLGTVFSVDIPALGLKDVAVKTDYISAMGDFATWRATKIKGDFDLKTFEIHARPLAPVDGLIAGMTVVTDWNRIR